MASGNTNKLTLKVGVVISKADILKQAKQAQKELDKAFASQTASATKTNKAQANTNKGLKEQQGLLKGISKEIKNNVGSMAKFAIASAIFLSFRKTLKEAISLMFDLDKAFTNFAIVSKATASELAEVNSQVDTMTVELGALKREVIDTVTEFSRAGFSIAESMTLARNAIMGANVGMTDLSKVTTFIVAGLKSFKLEAEDSARILDVLFRVSNTTAINLEGIGEAFLRSANTLNTAGASLEQASALIASANESIQDPAKVGTALKTIASRLRGIGDEGEVVPTLAEDFKQVGIEIQNADGTFRNIYDVFQDFANIYDTLDELTKESLLEKLAGKRQKNILIGLLENFDVAEQALSDALNATGEVAQANEKYLDSLEGRTKQLKEAWNQLLTAFSNTSALKGFITLLKTLVVSFTTIVDKAPLLIGVIGGLVVALNPLTGVIGALTTGLGAIAGLFGISSQAGKLFGDKIVELQGKISSLSREIATLDDRIADLSAIEDRTEAQEELLKALQEQLEIKKKLKEADELSLAIVRANKLKKAYDDVAKSLEKTQSTAGSRGRRHERSQGVNYGNQREERNNQKNLDSIKETEKALKLLRIEILEANEGLEESSEAYKRNAEELVKLDQELENISYVYANVFGIAVSEAKQETEELVEEVDKVAIALFGASRLSATATDGITALAEAEAFLADNGYLANDMLTDLLLIYPDLLRNTELTEEGLRSYGATQTEVVRKAIEDQKALLLASKQTAQGELDILRAKLKAVNVSIGAGIIVGRDVQNKIDGELATIANLSNELDRLGNTARAIDNVSSTSATKKITNQYVALSDLELKLKEVNFQISEQQKLYSRTDDVNEQIAISEKLKELYKEQKKVLIDQQIELEKIGRTLKKGTEEYDKYITASYSLSLAIEDATGSILEQVNAIGELQRAQEELVESGLEDDLATLVGSITDEIEKQIAMQEELAKASSDYYDAKIKGAQDELEALKASNEERENQVQLEELLSNLQDLRERRQNILDNKNARIVKDADVGFEFISNPEELKDVEADILSAEKAINDFRTNQIYEENVRKIEATIEGLEAQAEAEQDSYDQRIEELRKYEDAVTVEVENGAQIQINTVESLARILGNIENTSYENRLSSLSSFVTQYNSKVSQLNAQRSVIASLERDISRAQTSITNMTALGEPPLRSSGVGTVNRTTTPSSNRGSGVGSSNTTSSNDTRINRLNIYSGSDSLQDIIEDSLGIARTY